MFRGDEFRHHRDRQLYEVNFGTIEIEGGGLGCAG